MMSRARGTKEEGVVSGHAPIEFKGGLAQWSHVRVSRQVNRLRS
jgi:hypothetical protein